MSDGRDYGGMSPTSYRAHVARVLSGPRGWCGVIEPAHLDAFVERFKRTPLTPQQIVDLWTGYTCGWSDARGEGGPLPPRRTETERMLECSKCGDPAHPESGLRYKSCIRLGCVGTYR